MSTHNPFAGNMCVKCDDVHPGSKMKKLIKPIANEKDIYRERERREEKETRETE